MVLALIPYLNQLSDPTNNGWTSVVLLEKVILLGAVFSFSLLLVWTILTSLVAAWPLMFMVNYALRKAGQTNGKLSYWTALGICMLWQWFLRGKAHRLMEKYV